MLDFFFVSSLIAHWLFMNNFFCLDSACLLNKTKIKHQTWLIYNQTNINKFFIELSLSFL